MSQILVTGEAKIRDIQGPVVANSGVITALDGAASQYVRGDGTLADFPTSSGGGSSVSYYLNSSVSQGTIGGVAYRELSKEPIIGAGTDIAISANGYVASYLTDANDPDVILIPGGNFNCEFYFSVNNNTGNPFFYAELYKYDGTTFTLLGSSVGVPEYITQGTVINPYYFAIPVATATLALTDRLAIRIYVNVGGRTVTLHTENGHLCQVVTTLSKGMVSLNNLTDQSQFITTGTSGTNFAIVSSGDTHTFNLPVASATNTGKLSSTDWSTFNNKVPYTGATTDVDLGTFNLSTLGTLLSKYIYVGGNGTNSGFLSFSQYATPDLSGTNATSIYTTSNNKVNFRFWQSGVSYKTFNFDVTSLTTSTERTFTLPDLSGTLALLEGTQTFSGGKTFSNTITFTDYALMDLGVALAKTSGTPLNASTNGYANLQLVNSGSVNSLYLIDGDTLKYSKLSFNNAADYTYTFPAASGTLALTSDLSAYVTLATTQTISGVKTFSSDILVSGVRVGIGSGGTNNTRVGPLSFMSNTTGSFNTAIGTYTLNANTTGSGNTALGNIALIVNTTGQNNTAIGAGTLGNITTGSNNTGLGIEAGISITTGSNNTIIGNYAGTAAMSNNIVLADGAGNVRYQWNGTNNVFGNPISGTSATFSGALTVTNNVTIRPTSGYNAYFQTSGTALRINYLNDALSANVSASYRATDYSFQDGSGGAIFTLASTGAATFSSSVTAGTYLMSIGQLPAIVASSTFIDYISTNIGRFAATSNATGTFPAIAISQYSSNGSLGRDAIYINPSGNVGIGTSSPSDYSGYTTLHINGKSGTGSGVVRVTNFNGTASFNMYADAAATFNTTSAIPFLFLTQDTEGMRIKSGGGVEIKNFGAGDTGLYILAPNSFSGLTYNSACISTASTGWYHFVGQSGNGSTITTNNILIYGNGNVQNANNSYGAISDIKLKENIVDATPKLDNLMKVRIVNYSLKTDLGYESNKQIGVIAQELEQVFPGLVEDIEDFKEVEVTDEEGNVTKEKQSLGTVTKSVKYSVFIPMLIKSIQEQQAQIEELKAKIK